MSMRHVNHDYALDFDNPRDRWLSEQILLWNMMVLSVRNYYYLLDHPETPRCYDDVDCIYLVPEQLDRRPTDAQIASLRRFLTSQMRMSPGEIQHHVDLARGVEIMRDIVRMRENGGGDCDNWAARRAAECAVAGADVRPRMTHRVEGGRIIYHALCIWQCDGSSEDPSLIKGMGGPARAADRREECRKNKERYDNFWKDAKRTIEMETEAGLLPTEAARQERAWNLKAKIDALALLPRDGVFRVGVPRRQVSP